MVCLLLFTAGVIWGKLPVWSFAGVKDAIEIMSFLATISVAVLAAASVSMWREQWKFSASQDALKKLTSALEELSYVAIYIKSYAWLRTVQKKFPDSDALTIAKDLEEKTALELKQATKDFVGALQDVHILEPDRQFSGFLQTSQILHKKIVEITREIDRVIQTQQDVDDLAGTYASLAGAALADEILKARDEVFEIRKSNLYSR